MKAVGPSAPTAPDPAANAFRPLCVTINEAANLLSIGRTRLYELIADGELVVLKIGRSSRITTKSIDQFLERSVVRRQNR
jgi:excisionase family DNA binding protein